MKRMSVQVFISACLGIATSELIKIASRYLSPVDVLGMPSYLIAWLFYPAGVHTSRGNPNWGIVFLVSNIFFYAVLWFLIMRFVLRSERV